MRLFPAILVLLLSGCATPTPDAKRPAIDSALSTFTGTWLIVSTEPAGVTKNAHSLVFRHNMTYAALDNQGNQLWSGTYEIDPTASPKIWDHRSYEGQKKGADTLGIYDLTGDTLTVSCVTGTWKDGQWLGKPRPTQFTLPNADVVLDLRRAPAASN